MVGMDEAAVAWLREQVQGRLVRAKAATEGPWAWEATGEKDNSWAVGLVQDEDGTSLAGQIEAGQGIVIEGICEGIDGHLADAAHIVLNDPQDVIARCEAELGILSLHDLWASERGHPALGAAACAVSDAVRHVAVGYKHWPGYAEHYGSSVSA
jgi:hypothetical protein